MGLVIVAAASTGLAVAAWGAGWGCQGALEARGLLRLCMQHMLTLQALSHFGGSKPCLTRVIKVLQPQSLASSRQAVFGSKLAGTFSAAGTVGWHGS